MKKCSQELIKSLVTVVNSSLSEGLFPNQLKVVIIIVIYKKGSRKKSGNYSPIVILPEFNKIFEKIFLLLL